VCVLSHVEGMRVGHGGVADRQSQRSCRQGLHVGGVQHWVLDLRGRRVVHRQILNVYVIPELSAVPPD
jgi:hypothetical protein